MSVALLNERPAYVEFSMNEEEDRNATIEAGRYVPKFVEYVHVTLPGGKSRFSFEAVPWLKRKKDEARRSNNMDAAKIADYYEDCYKQWKEQQEIPLVGTPIRTWPAISPADCSRILAANIRTVEDLATANEEGLRSLGMGAAGLKKVAINWLKTAEDFGKTALQMQTLERDLTDTKKRNDALEDEVEVLRRQVEALSEKPRRGRPPKERELEDILQ